MSDNTYKFKSWFRRFWSFFQSSNVSSILVDAFFYSPKFIFFYNFCYFRVVEMYSNTNLFIHKILNSLANNSTAIEYRKIYGDVFLLINLLIFLKIYLIHS